MEAKEIEEKIYDHLIKIYKFTLKAEDKRVVNSLTKLFESQQKRIDELEKELQETKDHYTALKLDNSDFIGVENNKK